MPKRTIRAIFRNGHFEPLEGLDMPDGTEVNVILPVIDNKPNLVDQRSARTRHPIADEPLTRRQVLGRVNSRQRKRVALPVKKGTLLQPLVRDAAYDARLDKASLLAHEGKTRPAPSVSDMTDEAAMELALEAVREVRKASRPKR
jgi:predicted DNA-binding antitoxin AbrB/MazE fold protein